jgi:hypothetical protein
LGDLQLVVVGHFTSDATPHVAMVKKILTDREVKFYTLDRVEPLIDDIRRHAKKTVTSRAAE